MKKIVSILSTYNQSDNTIIFDNNVESLKEPSLVSLSKVSRTHSIDTSVFYETHNSIRENVDYEKLLMQNLEHQKILENKKEMFLKDL